MNEWVSYEGKKLPKAEFWGGIAKLFYVSKVKRQAKLEDVY